MKHHTHHIRILGAAVAGLIVLGLGNAGAAFGQAAESLAASERCQWTVEELPRTPDAIEGWYRGCPASTTLPQTPAGVEGWTG